MLQGQLSSCNDLESSAVAAQRALLARIFDSPQFIRSARLRELLTFICERAFSSDKPELNESEIGHHVFGRPEDYNPGDDNIVRVTARQLRVKLADYFATDGHAEALILEIPRGAYRPIFRPAVAAVPATLGRESARTNQFGKYVVSHWIQGVLLLIAATSAGFTLWLFAENQSLKSENAALRSPANPLSELVFDAENGLSIVVTDAGSQAVQYFAGRVVSLDQYAARQLPAITDTSNAARFLQSFALTPNTALADTVIAATIAESAGRHRGSIRIRHARSVVARDFYTENFVLIGGTRANPWTGLFEDGLNFAFRLDPASGAAAIINRQPRAGELSQYPPARPSHAEYSRVAVVPNLSGNGKVVLIAGTDMASTEGAGGFMLDPATLPILHAAFHTSDLHAFKALEMLLQVTTIQGTPLKAHLVAFRATSN